MSNPCHAAFWCICLVFLAVTSIFRTTNVLIFDDLAGFWPKRRDLSMDLITPTTSLVCRRSPCGPETQLPNAMEGIRQFYIALEKEEWKLDTLYDLYEAFTMPQAIVYANTRPKVEWLTEMMVERDFPVSLLHGDKEQEERDGIMREFRTSSSRVLITTDLVAPGVDVEQVVLAVNYDLPSNRENYFNRINRAGLVGHNGVGTSCKDLFDAFVCLIVVDADVRT
jgi:Lhr-like helicase